MKSGKMNEMNVECDKQRRCETECKVFFLQVSNNGSNFFNCIFNPLKSVEKFASIRDKNVDDARINVLSCTINLALEILFALHGIRIIAS